MLPIGRPDFGPINKESLANEKGRQATSGRLRTSLIERATLAHSMRFLSSLLAWPQTASLGAAAGNKCERLAGTVQLAGQLKPRERKKSS